MFSYYEKGFKGKKMDRVMSIENPVEHIKDHPQKDLISELRRTEYKSQKYNEMKETRPCITPAGIFLDSRSPEDILQLSSYLFFDIDLPYVNFEELKQKIADDYQDYISLLGVSVGGRGLFFYVKVNNLDKDNYTSVYEYLRTEVFGDLDIDNNAKGINRAHIIPYDSDLYFNPNSNVDISIGISKNSKKKRTFNIKDNKTGCYILNVSFLPIDEVWRSIKTQTEVEVGNSLFTIEPVDYLKLFIPKDIKDGRKHSTFRALTMAIMYLNPDVDLLTVQSSSTMSTITTPLNQ